MHFLPLVLRKMLLIVEACSQAQGCRGLGYFCEFCAVAFYWDIFPTPSMKPAGFRLMGCVSPSEGCPCACCEEVQRKGHHCGGGPSTLLIATFCCRELCAKLGEEPQFGMNASTLPTLLKYKQHLQVCVVSVLAASGPEYCRAPAPCRCDFPWLGNTSSLVRKANSCSSGAIRTHRKSLSSGCNHLPLCPP